jgi:hypothetical protein
METMELITKIAMLIGAAILALFVGACKPKPKPPEPEPEPEPEPVTPKWSDFYPEGSYQPIIDLDKLKWQSMTINEQTQYENLIRFFMQELKRTAFDDYTLSRIWFVKMLGEYYFKWASDMETWQKNDYWATPFQFSILKEGLGDCEDFAAVSCDYLYRMCNYWLVWWVEVYWQQYKGEIEGKPIWKSLGHAITIYKRGIDSPYRSFSNQSWLGRENGYETIMEIVRKFSPADDKHKLIKVKARHPLSGKLLFELKGGK